MDVPEVPVKELHARLGFPEPIDYPESSLSKPLTQWKMEIDDSPILRYVYRNFRPRRHLEFGTWEGAGVVYCLGECDASVWTINLLEGEQQSHGRWAYGRLFSALERLPPWSKKRKVAAEGLEYQTDSLGFIGRHYLEKGLGNRVCQIYCESRDWDISNYPDGFFDTVLVDGGHSEEVVTSDTRKALQLVRPGGLVMWHDFCPRRETYRKCASTRGVLKAVHANWDWISGQMKDIFWVNPSFLLIGVKAEET